MAPISFSLAIKGHTANLLTVDSTDFFCVQNPTVVHRYFVLKSWGFFARNLGDFTDFFCNSNDPDS